MAVYKIIYINYIIPPSPNVKCFTVVFYVLLTFFDFIFTIFLPNSKIAPNVCYKQKLGAEAILYI